MAYKHTIRDILESPESKQVTNIYSMYGMIKHLAFVLYSVDITINPIADLSRIKVLNKIDIWYDGRRGMILQVLYFDNEPIAIYQGAGREDQDIESSVILSIDKVKEVLKIVELKEESGYISEITDLDTEIELLYWEGTPVDLGTFGFVKVR